MKHTSLAHYEKYVEDVPIRLEVKRFYPAEFPGYGYPPVKASLTLLAHYAGDDPMFAGLSAEGKSPRRAIIALMEAMLGRRDKELAREGER